MEVDGGGNPTSVSLFPNEDECQSSRRRDLKQPSSVDVGMVMTTDGDAALLVVASSESTAPATQMAVTQAASTIEGATLAHASGLLLLALLALALLCSMN